MIDLRSDTVTRPSAAMRQAMLSAEVGDDVFGEDPTVNRLQDKVAELLGKEAALFVPSGTMANQLAIAAQTNPGDEIILERNCHIFNYESGAPGLLSGVQLNVLDGEHGILDREQVERAIRHGYYWEPQPRMLCLENTINRTGGTVYPLERMRALTDVARHRNLICHLDGARLWNASAATGIAEREYASLFDTVSVSLSKGLGAPVGSLIAGHEKTIRIAHRYRKLFGGGWRQAGVLAAAGLYALDHHRSSLSEDHMKATRLAEGLSQIKIFSVDLTHVETNILTFGVVGRSSDSVVDDLRTRDILVLPWGSAAVRATTHRDLSVEDINTAIGQATQLFQ